MYDTCIAPRISFRTRGSTWYSFNDYSYGRNERHPLAGSSYSSSRSCCSCCVNSVYRVPITPSYCYESYGLRQYYLIQQSCRKLVSDDYDRCFYYRLPACDFDRSCYCGNFREIAFGGTRFGFRKYTVFEGRGERCDLGGAVEAEVVLSLLAEDVGEESFHVGKKTKRLVKKSSVEKREDGEVCNDCRSKKKINDLGVHGSGTSIKYEVSTSSSRKGDNRREERIQEEEREALLRKEKLKAQLQEEKSGASIRKEDKTRGKLEREAFLRKESQKAEEKQERESLLRKENWVSHALEEEKEEFLRRADHRERVRKDGSSCSSYYSFSSAGDYESDSEIDNRDEICGRVVKWVCEGCKGQLNDLPGS